MEKNILEIRFHGRGGQGAKTAAKILGESAMRKGKYIQAFPEYGPERSGAPVKSFVRISDDEIKIHSDIHDPDLVLVLDPGLIKADGIMEGVTVGTVIVNSDKSPDEIRNKLGSQYLKVGSVNATAIAKDIINSEMVNLAMLGAAAKAHPAITVEDIQDTIEEKLRGKLSGDLIQKNKDAVKKVYEEVHLA